MDEEEWRGEPEENMAIVPYQKHSSENTARSDFKLNPVLINVGEPSEPARKLGPRERK